jgi:hypothetical protein
MKKDNMNTSFLNPVSGKGWILLLMVIVFICGGVVGGFLTARVIMTRAQDVIRSPSKVSERFTRRLTRILDLNEEQSRQMARILGQNIKTLGPLRNEIRHRLFAQMDHTQKEIEAILTPGQKKILEKRFKRIRERWLSAASAKERPIPHNNPSKDVTP